MDLTQAAPRHPWGKRDAQGAEHPLIDHCLDVAVVLRQFLEAPPRTRGSTRPRNDSGACRQGSPAHAGIDPEQAWRRWEAGELPRARGDRPAAVWSPTAATSCRASTFRLIWMVLSAMLYPGHGSIGRPNRRSIFAAGAAAGRRRLAQASFRSRHPRLFRRRRIARLDLDRRRCRMDHCHRRPMRRNEGRYRYPLTATHCFHPYSPAQRRMRGGECSPRARGDRSAPPSPHHHWVLMNNRHGLVVDVETTQATGTAKAASGPSQDRAYDPKDRCHRGGGQRLRRGRVHRGLARAGGYPACGVRCQGQCIDAACRRAGYQQRLKLRSRIEEAFGWAKTVGVAQDAFRGLGEGVDTGGVHLRGVQPDATDDDSGMAMVAGRGHSAPENRQMAVKTPVLGPKTGP